jgi:tetratricopeptide (TPR) repeat protein
MRIAWAPILACVLSIGPRAAHSGDVAPGPVLRTTVGTVAIGDYKEDRISFELVRSDQKFSLDPRRVASADEIFKALQDSANTSKSVSVHYFVEGASFAVGDSKPTYVVHDITYDERTIEAEQSAPAGSATVPSSERDLAASSLAKGIALAGDPDTANARKALSVAVASNALETALKVLALKTRSRLSADEALANWPAGAKRDELLFASLQDARAWQKLAPNDFDAAEAIAGGLVSLGAYDEGIALYRDIIAKSPDDYFWSEMRIEAAYRALGQVDKALAELDAVAKHGEGSGMAFHYHRGRALIDSGRYEDAVAEYNAGLREQPDYSGAFLQRSCALARLGRLQDAIVNYKEYMKVSQQYGHDVARAPGLKHDDERSSEVVRDLAELFAKDPVAKTDIPCVGRWDWGEAKRERSVLLPAVSVAKP